MGRDGSHTALLSKYHTTMLVVTNLIHHALNLLGRTVAYRNCIMRRRVAILECFAFNCTFYNGSTSARLVVTNTAPVGLDTPPSPTRLKQAKQGEGQFSENSKYVTLARTILLYLKGLRVLNDIQTRSNRVVIIHSIVLTNLRY